MKKISAFLVGCWIFVFTGVAQALPITDVFTPDPSPIELTPGIAYSYEHDLIAWGFDPVEDELTSATLSIVITGPGGQPLTITFDGDGAFVGQLNDLPDDIDVALTYLQMDGLLVVGLTSNSAAKGNPFQFHNSTLTVQGIVGGNGNGNGDPTQVPEPFTLALLGLGLLSLGIFRRRWMSFIVSTPQFA